MLFVVFKLICFSAPCVAAIHRASEIGTFTAYAIAILVALLVACFGFQTLSKLADLVNTKSNGRWHLFRVRCMYTLAVVWIFAAIHITEFACDWAFE
jgi:hypothetical protein